MSRGMNLKTWFGSSVREVFYGYVFPAAVYLQFSFIVSPKKLKKIISKEYNMQLEIHRYVSSKYHSTDLQLSKYTSYCPITCRREYKNVF